MAEEGTEERVLVASEDDSHPVPTSAAIAVAEHNNIRVVQTAVRNAKLIPML